MLAVLIVGAGIVALSPLTGIAAARETMVARRSRRASIAEAEQTHSEIWARQARRNALAREDPVAAWRYRSPFSP